MIAIDVHTCTVVSQAARILVNDQVNELIHLLVTYVLLRARRFVIIMALCSQQVRVHGTHVCIA